MTSYVQSATASGGEQVVFLFQLDLNPLGYNEVIYFCPYQQDPVTGSRVSFMGHQYSYLNVTAGGFEWSTAGASPQPTIKVSNVNRFASGLLLQYNDLVGAQITRIRTFARFLDGGPDSSVAATSYQMEIYRVEQKMVHNKVYAELRLASVLDQEGRKLPWRIVMRDTCMWRYRSWNVLNAAWDYTNCTCPYTGSAYFDENGQSVATPALDVPSQNFDTCCIPRFGTGVAYPFGGFQGCAATQ